MSKEKVSSISGFPLEGVRALELSEIWAGPFCGSLLADMGAEVISVERITAAGRGSSADIASRGKKSIAVDIRKPEGQEIIKKLIDSRPFFSKK